MASIVVYYSRTGENYWAGGIRSIEKGNTERIDACVRGRQLRGRKRTSAIYEA